MFIENGASRTRPGTRAHGAARDRRDAHRNLILTATKPRHRQRHGEAKPKIEAMLEAARVTP